jgi:transposase
MKRNQKKLVEHLRDHTYLHAKDIIAYVRSTYGIEYSLSGMKYWLKKHNFTYKKPVLVPGKKDPEAQKIGLKIMKN